MNKIILLCKFHQATKCFSYGYFTNASLSFVMKSFEMIICYTRIFSRSIRSTSNVSNYIFSVITTKPAVFN